MQLGLNHAGVVKSAFVEGGVEPGIVQPVVMLSQL